MPKFSKNLLASFILTEIFFKLLISIYTSFIDFSKNLILSLSTIPTSFILSNNLIKALSYLKVNLYSALDGSTLYGSGVFLCIKSSINTPMYASLLSIITGFSPFIFLAAFTPAINPCAAASS